MKWDDVGYLLGSTTSMKILECLNSKQHLTPLHIAKKINVAQSNVSTKLGHLIKRDLVECINPTAHKWRFYRITKKGKNVLIEVKKIKE